MSQQQIPFDQSNRDGPTTYTVGYEEIHYNDPPHLTGDKITRRESFTHPSAVQRLALAIISLVLLMIVIFAIVGFSFTMSAEMLKSFSPVMGLMSFLFFIAVIVVNFLFNRRRSG